MAAQSGRPLTDRMKKRPTSSPSMSTQLQIWTPEKKRERPSRKMDLAIVPSSPNSSFTLPDDWVVEERKRTARMVRGHIDKYYHEPGTGRTFRSLVSVKKYLMELDRYEITTREANRMTVCRKTYAPKHQVKIDRSKPLKLPDGWFIRRITRRSGQSMGRVDQYYCERSTGRVFRSKIDVQRYLADNYVDENPTLSELAGLIQMSRSEDRDVHDESNMAIVPHSYYKDSGSSISDDVPLKDLVRKYDDVPLKDLVRKSDDVLLKDLAPESDDVLLKNLFRKSSTARKTSKYSNKLASPKKNVLNCTTKTNTSSVNVSSPLTKIKWVLDGPGGDAWNPFSGDTMVPESLKQEWAQMFIDIVSQKQSNASSSDALE